MHLPVVWGAPFFSSVHHVPTFLHKTEGKHKEVTLIWGHPRALAPRARALFVLPRKSISPPPLGWPQRFSSSSNQHPCTQRNVRTRGMRGVRWSRDFIGWHWLTLTRARMAMNTTASVRIWCYRGLPYSIFMPCFRIVVHQHQNGGQVCFDGTFKNLLPPLSQNGFSYRMIGFKFRNTFCLL